MIFIGSNRVKILLGKEINDVKDVYTVAPTQVGINRGYETQHTSGSDTLVIS